MRYTEKGPDGEKSSGLFCCADTGLHIKNNKKILDGYNELVYTNHCKEVR